MVELNKILVFDLGGSTIKYGTWEKEILLEQGEIKTPSTWQAMKDTLLFIKKNLGNNFDGVAISCPGAVSVKEGVIHGSSAIPYIHEIPIKDELTKLMHLPLSIQNDANCAALAEVWKGNAQKENSAVFMIIGTGIGGAFVYNKQLVTGRHLFGGEFGWMLISKKETLSEVGSPVRMAENFTREKADGRIYTGKDVLNLYDERDPQAIIFVENMLDSLAYGLYNLCISFDADCYLIGGGISARKDIINQLREKTNLLLKRHGANDISPNIRACKFLNGANLLGAVYQLRLEFGLEN